MLEILLSGAASLLLLPVLVLFGEALLAMSGERISTEKQGERRRLAVVMPAHDEASLIAGTLRRAVPQLKKCDRLIVIADNCSDDTAGIATRKVCARSANLAAGHIVEDLKLGIDLARAGTAPLFCPDALVTSYLPTSDEGVQEQRQRWEHGHLGTMLSEAPHLLWHSLTRLDVDSMTLALKPGAAPHAFPIH